MDKITLSQITKDEKLLKILEVVKKENPLVISLTDPLFSTRLHGWDREIFYKNVKDYPATIVLIRTEDDFVLGGYCPDKWEDT